MHARIPVVALVVLAIVAGAFWRRIRVANEREPLGTEAACAAYDGIPSGFPDDPLAGMVLVRGGEFVPGSMHGYREEQPGRAARVADFYVDRTEVTVAQFALFVERTGYVTVAERAGAAPVFDARTGSTRAYSWWRLATAARFDRPDGGASARPNEPVVQIAYDDAVAYARWLGRDLPTEAQWEYVARAGRIDRSLDVAPRDASGVPLANYFQGLFPGHDTGEDGHTGRAPVGCFPPNRFGVHDLIGNVWEWTRDPYRGSHREAIDRDAAVEREAPRLVIKGGSYLCSPDSCARYRASARQPQERGMSGNHLGFRTVRVL